MAKGSVAKERVLSILKEAFGSDWIGEVDKKYYVWSSENDIPIQIAITLTCPKEQVKVINTPSFDGNLNFEDDDNKTIIVSDATAEITDTEQEALKSLLQKLGL